MTHFPWRSVAILFFPGCRGIPRNSKKKNKFFSEFLGFSDLQHLFCLLLTPYHSMAFVEKISFLKKIIFADKGK